MGRSPWDDRPWGDLLGTIAHEGGGSSTMRAETAPKGAAIVWCELNTNIGGFFQEFFLKKTFIYFIWLRQTILFTLGEGWEDTYIQNLCGILGICGMSRVVFLECVECCVSAA